MKIFVDFDRVAFDTDRLYKLLEAEDVPEPGTMESLDYLYPNGVEPLEDLLFEDFKGFAVRQKELGNELILVSSAKGFSGNWDFEYHREKIKRSGIQEFVKEIVAVEQGKIEVIRAMLTESEKAIFVDDAPMNLSEVHRLNNEGLNLLCVHMARDGERHTAAGIEKIERIKEFASVRNFEGVSKLIEDF